jgi:hypothetical protein
LPSAQAKADLSQDSWWFIRRIDRYPGSLRPRDPNSAG